MCLGNNKNVVTNTCVLELGRSAFAFIATIYSIHVNGSLLKPKFSRLEHGHKSCHA